MKRENAVRVEQPQILKCGHADEMDNLRWHRDDRNMNLGGSWRCRQCSHLTDLDYKATPHGQAMRQAYDGSDIRRAQKAAYYHYSPVGRARSRSEVGR